MRTTLLLLVLSLGIFAKNIIANEDFTIGKVESEMKSIPTITKYSVK